MADVDFENNPYYIFVTSTGERKSLADYFSEVNVFFFNSLAPLLHKQDLEERHLILTLFLCFYKVLPYIM